jgi:hypothetical protein
MRSQNHFTTKAPPNSDACRFDHTSEEHAWASKVPQRVMSRDDGDSIASTQIGSVAEQPDESDLHADADAAADAAADDAAVDNAYAAAAVAAAANSTLAGQDEDAAATSPSTLPITANAAAPAADAGLVQEVPSLALAPKHASRSESSPPATSSPLPFASAATVSPPPAALHLASYLASSDAIGSHCDDLHTDAAIERSDISGINDRGTEELDGTPPSLLMHLSVFSHCSSLLKCEHGSVYTRCNVLCK